MTDDTCTFVVDTFNVILCHLEELQHATFVCFKHIVNRFSVQLTSLMTDYENYAQKLKSSIT